MTGLLGLAVAVEVLEKDRKDIKEGKYKNTNIYSGFPKFISGSPKCQHCVSNRLWEDVGTIRVKRDGFGSAVKTIKQRCKRCGETREKDVFFADTRVKY